MTVTIATLALVASAATASVAGAQTTTTAPATSSSATTKSVLDKVKVTTPSGAGTTAPVLKFAKPLAVKKSIHKVLTEGTGAALTEGSVVTVDYVEVDGRTGKTVSTSYGAKPQTVTLDVTKSVPPLVQALLDTKVGGQTLVAVAPKDYAKKLQGAIKSVKGTDTLLFLMTPTGVRHPLARATGTAVTPTDGLPTVAVDVTTGKPTVTVPANVAAPTSLVVQPLIKGDGPVVEAGQTVSVHYTGIIYGSGKQFDSSWDRGEPADFVIGKGQVIPGWDKGLVGQTVGTQVLLVIPPADGYGTNGNTQAGISGTDTLVFVVDILDAY
ncbi:MAG: FKBP-type peptidyl-prolyl cis-trans isomerase [Acidimicrobiia bacterium]